MPYLRLSLPGRERRLGHAHAAVIATHCSSTITIIVIVIITNMNMNMNIDMTSNSIILGIILGMIQGRTAQSHERGPDHPEGERISR